MYGLTNETDLTFLLRRQLEGVKVSKYQAQLYFTGSISISIESQCELNKKPIAYEDLRQLVGNSVFGVTIQDGGSINVVFIDGTRLSVFDSNSDFESYQITAPGITIVV